jgi:hypothetical protein
MMAELSSTDAPSARRSLKIFNASNPCLSLIDLIHDFQSDRVALLKKAALQRGIRQIETANGSELFDRASFKVDLEPD